jgi:hypothetical protein
MACIAFMEHWVHGWRLGDGPYFTHVAALHMMAAKVAAVGTIRSLYLFMIVT